MKLVIFVTLSITKIVKINRYVVSGLIFHLKQFFSFTKRIICMIKLVTTVYKNCEILKFLRISGLPGTIEEAFVFR